MQTPTLLTFEEFLVLKRQFEEAGGESYQIVSDSMAPLIQVGDWVSVAPLHTSPEEFDLIVFYQNGHLICHCFIRESDFEQALLTSSLKYGRYDLPISRQMVLGKVTSHQLKWWHRWTLFWKTRRQ